MTSIINGIDDQRMYFKILQYMTKHDHFVFKLSNCIAGVYCICSMSLIIPVSFIMIFKKHISFE